MRELGLLRVKLSLESIDQDFSDTTSDLRYLNASHALNRFVESGSAEAKALATREFINLASYKGKYDQIRFIAADGREAIRVNDNGGHPAAVPESQLQYKPDRYYFRDTMALGAGQIYVSPLDLNIEHGRIEQPPKPMIRFGMPVFDTHGHKRGALVINYLGESLLRHLRHTLGVSKKRDMLLNPQGYWLLAPNRRDAWGFMYKNGRRFQKDFPDAWKAINRRDHGIYQNGHGIFAYAFVHPLKADQQSSTGTPDARAADKAQANPRDYYWIVVYHVPAHALATLRASRWRIGLMQFGLLLLVLVPGSLAFSWTRAHKRTAEGQIANLERRMRDITQSLAIGLFVLDRNGRLVMMNPEAEKLLGWTESELCGEKVNELIQPEDSVITSVEQLSSHPDSDVEQPLHSEDDLFVRKDGSQFHAAYVVSPLLVENRPAGTVISFQDISERKRMERELELLATHDELTGLYNRRELDRRIGEEIRRSERSGQYFAVLMLDIDHFKKINDNHGHQNGDQALKSLGETLRGMLRETDIAARFGGEEFTVILNNTTLEQAQQKAEQMRAAISEKGILLDNGETLSITISIGLSTYPDNGTAASDLIRAADSALYAAKQAGRNRVRVV